MELQLYRCTQFYYYLYILFQQQMSILEESHEHSICNNPENQRVNVYLRLANSKSVKIELPAEESVLNIKKKVKELMGIEVKNQILYYKGKELFRDKMLTLAEKAIIHVKNVEEDTELITVNIVKHFPQKINIFKLNNISISVSINPLQTIQKFLKLFLQDVGQDIDIRRTKIIECGRFLKFQKTFLQQKIQSLAEIHLILRKPRIQNQFQTEEDNKILIESVLKKSCRNSLSFTERKHKLSQSEIFAENIQQYEILQSSAYEMRKSDIFNQIQTEEVRRSMPNYFMPTKSSGYWKSQKVIKKELTPLKFSFRDYKKYEGPKSLRECNCKRKEDVFICSQGCIKTEEDSSPQESSSPLGLKVQKLKRLKTKFSMY